MQRDITLTVTVESGWLDDLRAVVGHNLMLQKWHDSGRPGGEPGPTTLLKLTDAEEASIDPIVTATLQVAAEVGIAQATAALVAAPDTLFDDDGGWTSAAWTARTASRHWTRMIATNPTRSTSR